MKRFLVVLLLMIVGGISLLLPHPLTWAQEDPTPSPPEIIFDFNRAYQDYLFQYNLYSQDHKEYLVAKDQYETYRTLTARTIAIEQSAKMLKARDQVVATFLAALRLKLSEDTNVATPRLNSLYVQLDKEAGWYRDHQEVFARADTIPDLLTFANQSQNRYFKSEGLIYQSLINTHLYKEELLWGKTQTQIEAVEAIINQIKENNDKETKNMEIWLGEAKGKHSLSWKEFETAADVAIGTELDSNQKLSQYNKAVSYLEQAHLRLKKTTANLSEIIREVKRGN